MAKRRMFSKEITESDAFTDMPLSTQSLYFHLGMNADDDGFVNNPKKIQRGIGASNDDLSLLAAKGFIYAFDTGIIVIKHWKINNWIQSDRYTPTKYVEERAMLSLKENKAYTLDKNMPPELGVYSMDTECIQDVSETDTQVRLGKVRLGKVSKDILSGKPDCTEEIVAYLNAKIGSSYKASSKKTQSLIRARISEGFTVSDFKAVIDKKASDWMGDASMRKYLRPETLFGTKFEGYLNQPAKGVRDDRFAKYAD